VQRLLIKVNSKTRWYRSERPSYIGEDDIPANCLLDLRPKDNALSLWLIEEYEENLQNVVTALAASCQYPDSFDFLLFDASLIQEQYLQLLCTPGKTPLSRANQWHRDLVELSAKKLVNLAVAIYFRCEARRIFKNQIKSWLTESLKAGVLEAAKLDAKMSAALSE
jgi:hypothetical protein